MKKSMIALAVLAAAAGTAQAASSVTLYGRVDVGYTGTTGETLNTNSAGVPTVVSARSKTTQAGAGQTRLGIKGQEDLGNGYAAIFQLEGRFNGDDGSKSSTLAFFDRESTVGLKTPYGSVRLGRSLASMERALGFVNIGNRTLDLSPYASAARHSNAAFYDATFGAVSFGGHVTTKGTGGSEVAITGLSSSTAYAEQTSTTTGDTKTNYGAYAKYSANGLTAALGYQKDGANTLHTKEWGVGLGYNMNPVFVNASYASLKDADGDKVNTLQANLGANLGAADKVAVIFQKSTPKASDDSGDGIKTQTIGLEYAHMMSKRTSIYANAAQVKKSFSSDDLNVSGKSTVWGVAVRHNF